VTIIAAFQCRDGLLMCADSEQSIGSEAKAQARKILLVKTPSYNVGIGGAGDSSSIEYIQNELRQRIALDRPTWDSVDSWLQRFAIEMWEACIGPYRGFDSRYAPEDLEFLIGLQAQGEYRLYKWQRRVVYQIVDRAPTSIGAGIIQSEMLLNELQFALPLTASEMCLLAVRMMLKVKQLVQGCGGKTEMILLRSDGGLTVLSTKVIESVEHLVEQVDTFFVDQVLQFISGVTQIDHADDLKDQADTIESYRLMYEQLTPRLRKRGLGTF